MLIARHQHTFRHFTTPLLFHDPLILLPELQPGPWPRKLDLYARRKERWSSV